MAKIKTLSLFDTDSNGKEYERIDNYPVGRCSLFPSFTYSHLGVDQMELILDYLTDIRNSPSHTAKARMEKTYYVFTMTDGRKISTNGRRHPKTFEAIPQLIWIKADRPAYNHTPSKNFEELISDSGQPLPQVLADSPFLEYSKRVYSAMEEVYPELKENPYKSRTLGERCYQSIIHGILLKVLENHRVEDPFKEEALVFLEEPEVHVHPKDHHWLVQSLLDLFPNMQFFISTLSPLVRRAVKKSDGGSSYGEETDMILVDHYSVDDLVPEIKEHVDAVMDKIYKFQIKDNEALEADPDVQWLRSELEPSNSIFADLKVEIIKNKKCRQ